MLGFEQARGPVERDTAVIADDSAATVGIRKPGDDAGLAAFHDLRRVGIEDPVIVGLAIVGECIVDLRIGLEAGGLQARLDHAQSAVGENRALERLIRLQADDDFVVAIDVAGLVGEHGRWCFCVDGQNALLLLFLEIGLELVPHLFGPLGRPQKEFLIAAIRRDVADDEIADVDAAAPAPALKSSPAIFILGILGKHSGPFHGTSPRLAARFRRPLPRPYLIPAPQACCLIWVKVGQTFSAMASPAVAAPRFNSASV